jgi:imidazolonepropionase-like amidohydrolase
MKIKFFWGLLSFALIALIAANFGLAQSKQPDVLIRNATVLTASHGKLENTDILLQNGKIVRIGKDLKAPANAQIIDATGKFVTPGIIDCHSHSMLDDVNEITYSVTSMTQMRDVLNPTDIALYRALAGGVTTLNLLHGSANSIGGQNAVVKIKYGHPMQDFIISDAPPGIKFALGENPKRSHFAGLPGQTRRYPQTRMGVEETIRDAFVRARDYKASWDNYNSRVKRGEKNIVPPRRDLELEPLVEVLEGKRFVHAHSYRGDEILMLLNLANEFGFKVRTLQHALEAYKVAPEVAKMSAAGVSIFTDFWSYKLEAFDTIPYNAAILWRNGVTVSINSDDNERMRRLNIDAAKVMKYGGVPEQDALRMITLNPAFQLGIDRRTGSIDTGKDADLVVWSSHPFDIYSRVEMTFVEGEKLFDRAADINKRAALETERKELEKAEPNKPAGTGAATPPAVPRDRPRTHLDDAEDEGDNR